MSAELKRDVMSRLGVIRGFAAYIKSARMWIAIQTPQDASKLMEAFGYFHDSCMRDMQVWGGYCVSQNLSMTCPLTPDLNCRILVQRQACNFSAVELLFQAVSHASLAATAGYDRIISEATLKVEPGRVIWSPDREFQEDSYRFDWSSAVVATRAWWRAVQDLGPAPVPSQLKDLPSDFAL